MRMREILNNGSKTNEAAFDKQRVDSVENDQSDSVAANTSPLPQQHLSKRQSHPKDAATPNTPALPNTLAGKSAK